jgi:hypothetical protein
MNPSDSHHSPPRLRSPLYAAVDAPPASPRRVSSTALLIFHSMPSLLPRKISAAASVLQAAGHWPSPYVHWVGISDQLTRLHLGSLALRPAALPAGNLRPLVARTPPPSATKAHGQLLGRDSNPQEEQLLLRTDVVSSLTSCRLQQPQNRFDIFHQFLISTHPLGPTRLTAGRSAFSLRATSDPGICESLVARQAISARALAIAARFARPDSSI